MAEKELAGDEFERLVALPEGTKSFICMKHFKLALENCVDSECRQRLNAHCGFVERFASLLVDHLLRSDESWEICQGKIDRLPIAMQKFSPYCCHLGEEKLEVIYVLIRDRGWGRAGTNRIGWVSQQPTAQLPTTFPKDVM